ncbi:hypothetical protein Dsin_025354 [Dipteronia sinensis]|uniref:Myb/SANT-like domain-containing protein n=1 Tax=Dipteronia sinensis TaxID=43782 RepID=A0AAE0DY98_9ROSI|nr:hypothetical protein Dsin_025354 [Dipteronia sinensis]
MLLQLMVDAASRGWRDANGMLSKAIVESRILPILNEKLECQKTHNNYLSQLKFFKGEYQKYSQLMRHSSGFGWMQPQRSSLLLKKFGKITLSPTRLIGGFRNKNCDDYKDLQIVIGNATATRKKIIRIER